mmetsp:Transcript_96553/g.288201  ORF Transcript_96553/g.288201 Transcript_96553/m.288201 type:complete len:246 (-) Transcript_96553:261-998(-)
MLATPGRRAADPCGETGPAPTFTSDRRPPLVGGLQAPAPRPRLLLRLPPTLPPLLPLMRGPEELLARLEVPIGAAQSLSPSDTDSLPESTGDAEAGPVTADSRGVGRLAGRGLTKLRPLSVLTTWSSSGQPLQLLPMASSVLDCVRARGSGGVAGGEHSLHASEQGELPRREGPPPGSVTAETPVLRVPTDIMAWRSSPTESKTEGVTSCSSGLSVEPPMAPPSTPATAAAIAAMLASVVEAGAA